MAPPGEPIFSTEFFTNTSSSCPHIHKYPWGSFEGGIGIVQHRIQPMLMAVPYFFFWFILRKICKSFFPKIAKMCGIKKKSVQEKFSYQLWLGLYYTVSTIVGAYGYHDESWFQFPLGNEACVAILDNWPPTPSPFMEFAYQYQLGFYFAELYAIFNEPRRSDFMEYVIHHVTTILLVSMSNVDLQVRVGCYVFFIHDIPDIFLCLAKCMHYLKKEVFTNTLFVLFVVTFFFNRLICLPSCLHCIFCVAPSFPSVTFSLFFQIKSILLGVVLQTLHVFWFALILRMVFRLATGVKGDVRSDDDDDEEVAVVEKGKTTKQVEENKKNQ